MKTRKPSRTILVLATIITLASAIAAGCGVAPTPRVVEKEVVIEKTVVVEKEVEKVITPTPSPKIKTLTIGMSQEPKGWGVQIAQIAAIEVEQSMNANLTYRDGDLNMQPWLAEKIPSLKDGDWIVNDDGTMEVTWKLRKGVTWHDGTPFTVEDVIFGWEVLTDPEVPAYGKGTAQKIDRIEKVDDYTFIAYWKEPYIFADQGLARAIPVPEHILRDVYETDKEKFRNHPYWTTEFVGTGPYKMVEWEPGSHIVLEAYDGYFLGRPKIDRVVWRFITDSNTLMANIITGAVDVTVIPSISLDQGLIVKEAWDKTGAGEVTFIPGFGWDWMVLNRFEDPKFEDVRVRKALMYSIDRQALVDTLYQGFNPVAHSPIAPRHPLYTEKVQASMVKYEYDPEKAAKLFAEAGWTKGPDGILTNEAGDKFTVSIRTVAGQKDKENAEAIIADYWREAGIKVEIDNLPPSQIYDPQHLFHMAWPSVFLFNFGGNPNALPDTYTCDHIPSEENNWSTANIGQFCNEDWDRLYNAKPIDQMLEVSEREQLAAKLMPIWTDNLAFLPLYYKSEVSTVRKGVTGVWPTGTNEGWTYNIHEWDVGE